MKTLILKGSCYVLIAMGAPWTNYLGNTTEVTPRMLALTGIVSAVAGASALLAFLSTAVANQIK